MAILDTDKVDFLWKKVNFGVTKTATTANKAGSNETIASPTLVYASNIWTQTDSNSIPAVPPGASTATVKLFQGAQRIRLTNDTTSTPNQTWLVTSTYGNASTQFGNFIQPTFGPGYVVQVYVGDPQSGGTRIYPDNSGFEYVFDYVAGVLYFVNGIPAGVSTNGVYIYAYQYTGNMGVAATGSTSKTTVVANIAARDALTGLAIGDMVYVTDASGIPTDAASGEWALYMWNGTAFVCTATQDSARSDALTGSVDLTPSSVSQTLGSIGNGARVVEISVTVNVAFDGDFDITVGDAGNASRLLDDTYVDLSTVGTYVVTPTYRFPTAQETALLLAVTGSATVGSATVCFTYA